MIWTVLNFLIYSFAVIGFIYTAVILWAYFTGNWGPRF